MIITLTIVLIMIVKIGSSLTRFTNAALAVAAKTLDDAAGKIEAKGGAK